MTERLFGTDGMRGRVGTFPMTVENALRLGIAAGTLFRNNQNKRSKVIIGKDTRLSGYIFESALTAGLCASGMDVFQVGPLPTPAIAFLTKNMRADFGIVISASHNQFHDNGIKFFDEDGYKLPDVVEDEMAKLVFDKEHEWRYPSPENTGRAYRINDAPGRYIVSLKNSFPEKLSLKGIRIVLDCANGANYKVAPLALEELGAEVISFGVEPNGTNINKNCGSLFPEQVQRKVLELRANIGISLDGDADRLVLVDELGQILDGDQIMAICALDLKKKGELKNNILVSTVMSNLALELCMRENGIQLIRTNVGDRYVVEAMREHNAILGGEQSGHLIFNNYSSTGDGLLASLQILKIMCERNVPLSSLAGVLQTFPQVMINVPIQKRIPLADCKAIQDAIQKAEKELHERGRILLRYSGTELLCRIMVEGENEEKVKKIAEHLATVVKKNLV